MGSLHFSTSLTTTTAPTSTTNAATQPQLLPACLSREPREFQHQPNFYTGRSFEFSLPFSASGKLGRIIAATRYRRMVIVVDVVVYFCRRRKEETQIHSCIAV